MKYLCTFMEVNYSTLTFALVSHSLLYPAVMCDSYDLQYMTFLYSICLYSTCLGEKVGKVLVPKLPYILKFLLIYVKLTCVNSFGHRKNTAVGNTMYVL